MVLLGTSDGTNRRLETTASNRLPQSWQMKLAAACATALINSSLSSASVRQAHGVKDTAAKERRRENGAQDRTGRERKPNSRRMRCGITSEMTGGQ
jgi:hypothetical protein